MKFPATLVFVEEKPHPPIKMRTSTAQGLPPVTKDYLPGTVPHLVIFFSVHIFFNILNTYLANRRQEQFPKYRVQIINMAAINPICISKKTLSIRKIVGVGRFVSRQPVLKYQWRIQGAPPAGAPLRVQILSF